MWSIIQNCNFINTSGALGDGKWCWVTRHVRNWGWILQQINSQRGIIIYKQSFLCLVRVGKTGGGGLTARGHGCWRQFRHDLLKYRPNHSRFHTKKVSEYYICWFVVDCDPPDFFMQVGIQSTNLLKDNCIWSGGGEWCIESRNFKEFDFGHS